MDEQAPSNMPMTQTRQAQCAAYSSSFATLDFMRAMAPVKVVLASFQRQHNDWCSFESQGRYARLVESLRIDEFAPLPSYMKGLVRQYVAQVEARGHDVEHDDLLSLILHFSMTKDDILPDPLESCYLSFRIRRKDEIDDVLLRLQVFPRHNDVSLKLWEAGACLAEYLMEYPQHVAGKKCCELGSGVGLTGLIVAGCCQPTCIHMTDYTDACLINLKHNTQVNREWLQKYIQDEERVDKVITQGYLDWEEYAKESGLSPPDSPHQTILTSVDSLLQAQVLLAADVVYDISFIPCLSQTVHWFLSSNPSENVAIFATTFRNKATFACFEQHLLDLKIECSYVERDTLDNLPYVFPVYNVQPRSDVRICFMRLSHCGLAGSVVN